MSIGTRHRAAIGVTEETDAVVVIVSEETGTISIAMRGELKRHLTHEQLSEILIHALIDKQGRKKNDVLDMEIANAD